MLHRSLFVTMGFWLCLVGTAWAAQSLEIARQGGWSEFVYVYPTHDRQQQQLRFMLNSRQLAAGANSFKGFDKAALQDYLQKGLTQYAESMPQAKIRIDRIGDSLSFSAVARDEATAQEAVDLLKQQTDFLENNFLRERYYIKDQTDRYYMPDHARIIRDYVGPMRPVGKAIVDQSGARDTRQTADAVLNFIQAIPYDLLEDRTTSNGAGFTTPFGLLLQNRGDCDTKTVALAAILRGLYPKLRMMVVYTHQHAFIGLAVPAQSGDRIITVNRRTYVLAEPAGPGLIPIGQLGQASNADLDRDYFSYLEIP